MKPQTSVESVDIDKALEAFGGSRFQLILAAAVRAREIATKRTIAERNGDRTKYVNRPSVTALQDFAEGRAGAEYLNKLR